MNLKLIALFSILQLMVNRIEGEENICNQNRCCNVNLYRQNNNWVLTEIPSPNPNNRDTFELRCFNKERADNCKRSEMARQASTKIEFILLVVIIVGLLINVVFFFLNWRRDKRNMKRMMTGQCQCSALQDWKSLEVLGEEERDQQVNNLTSA